MRLIIGLMAQGYKPEVSALMGAYIHGLVGEMAEEEHGVYGVTAGDIAANIGKSNPIDNETQKRDMKHQLTALLLAAAAMTACAQTTQKFTASKLNEYGLVYNLPLTAVDVTVEAENGEHSRRIL